MRNWNPGSASWYRPERTLPDYLWGIETTQTRSLSQVVWLPDYLWGIETSMFLSLSDRIWLPDYLWGIETRRCQRDPSESWASRLPMRNWNLCTFFRLSQKISLPDYLWGIETRKWYAENKERVKGFQTTYEELKLYLSMWLYLSWASRLPMRNWN